MCVCGPRVRLSARSRLWRAVPCECFRIPLMKSSVPATHKWALRIPLFELIGGDGFGAGEHPEVIVGVSAFSPNSLATVMLRDLAAGIVRGVQITAPLRLGLVNQCVLPIAPDEAALSPLVQLGIPPDPQTAMVWAHRVVSISRGVLDTLSRS
jgi:hypothetical protein